MGASRRAVASQTFNTVAVAVSITKPFDGSTLILSSGCFNGIAGQIQSISQGGASWVKAAELLSGSNASTIWYAENVSNASTGVTVNYHAGGGQQGVLAISEYRGLAHSSSLEDTDTKSGSSTTPQTDPITSVGTKRFALACFTARDETGVYSDPQNGFGDLLQWGGYTPPAGSGQRLAQISRRLPAATSTTPLLTLEPSDSWSGCSGVWIESGLVTEEWKRVMQRSGVTPRKLYEFFPSASTIVRFTDGPSTITDAPPSVSSGTAANRAEDLLGSSSQIDSMTIVMVRDASVNSMFSAYGMIGTRVNVHIGEESLGEGDYGPFFSGVITAITPNRTTVVLKVKGSMVLLRTRKIRGHYVNLHPLEAIEEIFEAADIDPELYDSASFNADVDSSTSHLVVDFLDSFSREPRDSHKLIKRCTNSIFGHLSNQEDGPLRFLRTPTSTSAADHWTADDYQDLIVTKLYDNLFTRVSIVAQPYDFLMELTGGENYRAQFKIDDTDAQTRYAFISSSGSTDGLFEYALKMDGVNAVAWLQEALASGDSSFNVLGIRGFSGARWPGFPTTTQPLGAKISASRPAYLAIVPISTDRTISFEIIKSTSLAIATDSYSLAPLFDIDSSPDYTDYFRLPRVGTYSSLTRNQFGTGSPASWAKGVMVFDITAAVLFAEDVLARYANGGWEIQVTTSLSKYEWQVSDVITLDCDYFLAFGKTSLSNTVKWEIIGKSVDTDGEPPKITWTLQFLADSGGPSAALTRVFDAPPARYSRDEDHLDESLSGERGAAHVSSGFDLSLTGGLGVQLSPGFARFDNARVTLEKDLDITVTDDKVTSIAIGFDVHDVLVIENTDGIEPAFSAIQHEIWRVTAASGVITVTEDKRNTGGIKGERLEYGSFSPVAWNPDTETPNFVRNGDFAVWSSPRAPATHPPDAWRTSTPTGVSDPEFHNIPRLRAFETGTYSSDASPTITLTLATMQAAIPFPATGEKGESTQFFLVLAMNPDYDAATTVTQTGVTWTRIDFVTAANRGIELWKGVSLGAYPGDTTIDITHGAAKSAAWMFLSYYHISDAILTGSLAKASGSSGTAAVAAIQSSTITSILLGIAAQDDGSGGADFTNFGDGFVEIGDVKNATDNLMLSVSSKVLQNDDLATDHTFSCDLDSSDDWAALALVIEPSGSTNNHKANKALWAPGDVEDEQVIVESGDHSIKIDHLPANVNNIQTEELVHIEPNKVYLIEAATYRAGSSAGLRIQGIAGDKQSIVSEESVTAPWAVIRQWAKIRARVYMGPRATWLRVSSFNATLGALYLDQVKIQRSRAGWRLVLDPVPASIWPIAVPGGSVPLRLTLGAGAEVLTIYDLGAFYDSVNFEYHIPYAMTCVISSSIRVIALPAGKKAWLMLYVNGTEVVRGVEAINYSAGVADVFPLVQAKLVVKETDVVSVYVAHDDAGASTAGANFEGDFYFEGEEIN